ncbi:MAG: hypothetical protein C0399_03485 [Syntrophus sp. (in: bacteria)]|nr:hypothetical protein [Syntrophus sp. (in: bacteria)]
MPSNRTKRTRGPRSPLTEPERHLLLTGDPCLKPGRYTGWVRPFMLVSPAGREELRTLWMQHENEILQQQKSDKKKGLPWASKEFDLASK